MCNILFVILFILLFSISTDVTWRVQYLLLQTRGQFLCQENTLDSLL